MPSFASTDEQCLQRAAGTNVTVLLRSYGACFGQKKIISEFITLLQLLDNSLPRSSKLFNCLTTCNKIGRIIRLVKRFILLCFILSLSTLLPTMDNLYSRLNFDLPVHKNEQNLLAQLEKQLKKRKVVEFQHFATKPSHFF